MEDSVYLPKCLLSPSCCIPKHEEYRRLPVPAVCSSESSSRSNRSRWLWRKLLRRVLREGNRRPPPLTFQYDAVSYSQNFDDGCHNEDHHHLRRFSPVFRDPVRSRSPPT